MEHLEAVTALPVSFFALVRDRLLFLSRRHIQSRLRGWVPIAMLLRQLWRWLRGLFCVSLPVEIPDSENVVRGIYYDVYFNDKGLLKWQAYDPTPGTDEVSVMRSGRLSPTACKRKAISIETPPRKRYRGLAALNSGAIERNGLKVIDSRHVYCGHADIKTGVVTQKRIQNVPRDPREVACVKRVAEKLLELSRYYPDSRIESAKWEGEDLLAPLHEDA